jgi:hypothetical protein
MHPEFENELAAQVHSELCTLGEIAAPPALKRRIMQAVEERAAHSRAWGGWQSWPLVWQLASLVGLVLLFGGFCYGFGEIAHAAKVSAAGQQAGEWFAWCGVLWKTAGVLADAVATVVRHLGIGILIGCGLMLLAAYMTCVGLGTACVRLALARR